MTRRRAALAILLTVTVTVAGCRIGTDLPEDEVPQLQLSEVEDVVSLVLVSTLENSVFSANHTSFQHSHGQAALHRHPMGGPYVHDLTVDGPSLGHHNLFEFDLTLDTPCGVGGTVLLEAEVSGEGNPAIEPGSVHYIFIQTHSDCVLDLSGPDGGQFVLNASPYLTVEAHATNDGAGTVTVFGTVEGGIEWEGDAKKGVCEMELEYTVIGASLDEIVGVPITGTFCQLEVDFSVLLG